MPMYDNSDWRCNPEELDPCLAAEVRIKNDLLDIRQSRCLLCFILATLTVMLLAGTFVVLAYSGQLPNRLIGFPTPENPPSKLELPPIVPVIQQTNTHHQAADGITRGLKSFYNKEIALLPPIEGQYSAYESFTSRYYYLAPDVPLVDEIPAKTVELSSDPITTSTITTTTPPAVADVISPKTTKSPAPKAPTFIRRGPTSGGESNRSKSKEATSTEKPDTMNVAENLLAVPFDYINTSQTLEDCTSYRLAGYNRSGVYNLSTTVNGVPTTFSVLCLMDTVDEREAWTVLHRRTGTALAYWNATFAEYADGFGDPRRDHWLGLDRLHALTASPNTSGATLRIVVDGRKCAINECGERGLWWGEWEFSIGNRAELFNITHVRYLRGNISSPNVDYFSSISRHQAFTTVDSDNDKRPKGNSAAFRMKGGWWHQDFTFASLNGAYGSGARLKVSEGQSWYWRDDDGVSYYIKPIISLMMFRREAAADGQSTMP